LSAWRRVGGELPAHGKDIRAEPVELGGVRFLSGSNCHVDSESRPQRRKQLDADELPESPLEAVPIYCGMSMTRNDDAHAWMSERGSEDSDVEVHGPDSLPLLNGRFQVGSPR
jgi:hypothetical protein